MLRQLLDKIAFRTTKRYTVIKIRSLRPNYYDKDTLMLHGVMQLVVDYVECELSALEVWHENYELKDLTLRERLYLKLPWFLRSDELVRSRERGMRQLEFEKSLDSDAVPEDQRCPEQAKFAREVEAVYLWWTDVYPNRPQPEDAAELDKHFAHAKSLQNKEDEWNYLKAVFAKCDAIEEQYTHEEAEMLKRVVEIRRHLWT